MFRLKLKSVLLSSLMVAFLSSCNVMGVLKNQKNLVGRYYDGALNEKELKKFNPSLAKAYLVASKETDFKKPYIIGKCIADSIVSHLPKNSYQSFADWQILITASDRVSISAIGNRLLLVSQGAMEYFDTLEPHDVHRIALEIAMVGVTGIDPKKKYSIKSIPDKEFGGYQLLAYYYVSWARAIPEKLDALGLPFSKAYESALQMYNAKNQK